MKTKLLMVLLILSLGFNIGVFVTFGHHWLMKNEFGKWPKESSWHKGRLKKMLKLTDDQAKLMEEGRKELQDKITPIRQELKQKRVDLFAALDGDKVDSLQVDKLIGDISVLQMKIEKTVIEHSIDIRKNLTPEQQVKFRAFLKKGFEKNQDLHNAGFVRGEHGNNF